MKCPGSHIDLVFVLILMCTCAALTAQCSQKWFTDYLALFITVYVIKQTEICVLILILIRYYCQFIFMLKGFISCLLACNVAISQAAQQSPLREGALEVMESSGEG